MIKCSEIEDIIILLDQTANDWANNVEEATGQDEDKQECDAYTVSHFADEGDGSVLAGITFHWKSEGQPVGDTLEVWRLWNVAGEGEPPDYEVGNWECSGWPGDEKDDVIEYN